MNNNIKNINGLNFKAIPIARTTNNVGKIRTNIDLYLLNSKDKNYLDKLAQKTFIPELMSKFDVFERKRWQQVFVYAMEKVRKFTKNTFSILAVSDNKPCGIMVLNKNKNDDVYLDVATMIPVGINKNVKYSGKTLFDYAFKFAKKTNSRRIQLQAIQGGPYDVISKYKEYGFVETGYAQNYVQMECSRFKIEKQCKCFDEQIDYQEITEGEEVDLEEYLSEQ